MTTATECWQWILTARPDMKLLFLQEMFSAWQYTVDKRMGLFSDEESQNTPLAVSESCKLSPYPSAIKPHEHWISFIVSLIETAKYCCQETVEIISLLLHRSLPLDMGLPSDGYHLNRHVSSVGTRFKLLSCGLLLLQSDVLLKSVSKNILRERVYCNSLDYFCREKQTPTQNLDQLRTDIITLIKFWQVMHSEKKYLFLSHDEEEHVEKKVVISGSTTHGFMNFSPMNTESNFSTLTPNWKTTSSSVNNSVTCKRVHRNRRYLNTNSYIKDYIRKRNLILELLAVEIELLLVSEITISLIILVHN